MAAKVAILATLDTKGDEAAFVREQVRSLGGETLVVDLGIIDPPTIAHDIARGQVLAAGGTSLAALGANVSRQQSHAALIAGARRLLTDMIDSGEIGAVLGMGGTQGTSLCAAIMQALPYGLPKVLVSTVASGDCSAFVDIKDINMFFSVSDLLGLNPITRIVLANAAAAAWGMTQVPHDIRHASGGKAVIGMTNLGVLTHGAMRARERFEAAGHEVIVFHAVGSGGRAMEQMMREGLITAVFDYALGEIADDVFHGLRAGGPTRLTVAGELGLPQVICPGGSEHIGLILKEPNVVPAEYRDHQYEFHSPVIFAPRLKGSALARVAEEIGRRLAATRGNAKFLIPLRGTSRYAVAGGPLHDPQGDAEYFSALDRYMPSTVRLLRVDAAAEDDVFVDTAVDLLLDLIEAPIRMTKHE